MKLAGFEVTPAEEMIAEDAGGTKKAAEDVAKRKLAEGEARKSQASQNGSESQEKASTGRKMGLVGFDAGIITSSKRAGTDFEELTLLNVTPILTDKAELKKAMGSLRVAIIDESLGVYMPNGNFYCVPDEKVDALLVRLGSQGWKVVRQ
jgi:hypothetical protein